MKVDPTDVYLSEKVASF